MNSTIIRWTSLQAVRFRDEAEGLARQIAQRGIETKIETTEGGQFQVFFRENAYIPALQEEAENE